MKLWSHAGYPFPDGWVNKVYFIIRKNKTVTFIRKLVELEIIMLNKIDQTQKDTYCIFSLTYEIHRVKTSQQERTVREGDREEGKREGQDR